MSTPTKGRRFYSALLVSIQLGALFLLVYFGARETIGILPTLLVVVGIVIAVVGVYAMRLGNLSVMPIPKADAKLVTGGIYRYIRHPMYTGVLLVGAGFAVNDATLVTTVLWFVLLVVLIAKLRFEERMLCERFPEYANYMTTSKRIIPFVW